jgi:hypothetical protein
MSRHESLLIDEESPKSPTIGTQHGSISPDKKNTLLHLNPLGKIIECALISPYIKNEKPLSLMIVAKPEHGKTTIMKQYRQNKGIAYVTDCTAFGLTRDLLPKMTSGDIRTLMIPDLLTPLSKSAKTRQTFVAFLNNLIEEGIVKITTYTQIWTQDVNCNVITAVTDQALEDGRHEWAKIGFLSRFIIFSYSYSLSTVMEIMNHYSNHALISSDVRLQLPKNLQDIELPREIADKLNPVAMKVGEQFELHGIRAKINFRSLLKCLACRNAHRVVTDTEYREFLELADYMNFSYKPMA